MAEGLFALEGVAPTLPGDGDFWIAPGAQVMGRVVLMSGASIWFNAVLRGDNEPIVIGEGSNIQDGSILHTDPGCPLSVGRNCTVGHRAILHGCVIGDGALIGMGATVMNRAVIGRGALIGAGAMVTEGKEIPEGALVLGAPGKVVRMLADEEREALEESAVRYRDNMRRFREGLVQV
ncbi:MAG: gamma carbonic anhydrase family protein [Alphaproteobacteria bacterium]|nr:MAG: gamma carbonic anhydrase family protein [Alphaproteobacteria bacterium]